MDYRFKESNHRHELLVDGEWRSLTGITTILGVIAKPQLIQWAANMAVNYIDENLLKTKVKTIDLSNEDTFLWVTSVLEQARKAHQRKKEAAGQKGTDVHALIEERIKKAIAGDGFIKENGATDKQVKEFIQWAIDGKVKFLESELHVYSETHFLGGICDFVCEIEGEIWIGDIKTGGVYAEAFFQMAGYQILIEEMKKYSNIKGHIVIGLKDGFKEKRSISNEQNKQAFLSALSLYRIMQMVQDQIL
jgi:hypothetical protein